ncbi:hypothetical protein F5B20DRAFT_313740 [Whalleya microplaca]|nr:hypothetical protein F5B20DRAFT_313740 [Whalleya microplaca]
MDNIIQTTVAHPDTSFFRPKHAEDWEEWREIISELYKTMELKVVMREMEEVHRFKATEKQYKIKLTAWGLDKKYIRPQEYLAMVKKKRKRETGQHSKATQFKLRGEDVNMDNVTRWEKRNIKKGKLSLDDTLSEVGTPGSLECFTPRVGFSPAPLTPQAITPTPTLAASQSLSHVPKNPSVSPAQTPMSSNQWWNESVQYSTTPAPLSHHSPVQNVVVLQSPSISSSEKVTSLPTLNLENIFRSTSRRGYN